MTPEEFIAALGPAAKASEIITGIPAAFTVIQGALESTWGRSALAVKAKNLFSIKADASWHGPYALMPSDEVIQGKRVMLPAKWRVYDTWQACLDDRAAFLRSNPRYAHCFAETTPEGWARAIQAAGYATDPDYATKIISMIHSHGLSQFNKKEPSK